MMSFKKGKPTATDKKIYFFFKPTNHIERFKLMYGVMDSRIIIKTGIILSYSDDIYP